MSVATATLSLEEMELLTKSVEEFMKTPEYAAQVEQSKVAIAAIDAEIEARLPAYRAARRARKLKVQPA